MDADKVKKLGLFPVMAVFTATSYTMVFDEPFNQCTFFNYDPNNSVWINDVEVAAAITAPTGQIFPTKMIISLNAGEVYTDAITIDTRQSATANVQIIYTQYKGVGL